jgi:hypothetical protein
MKVSLLHCSSPGSHYIPRRRGSCGPRCLGVFLVSRDFCPSLLAARLIAHRASPLTRTQVVTPEQAQGYRSATIAGGLKGAGLGFGIAIPAHFLLQRRAAYRAVPITLKTLGYVCLLVPLISIAAEKSGEAYDRSQWTGVGARELERSRDKEERRWEDLSSSQKVRDWAARNKWGLIAGR